METIVDMMDRVLEHGDDDKALDLIKKEVEELVQDKPLFQFK
jgi:glycine/serine hydroxymethyltransferase